ncbi:hypothetical protein DPX16_16872 [Anabarilius grahami]|uniref:Uncharacterized protein n=1 Tax=Anabarilius grahami TaxID=495550 RepID=A0A3N0YST0_ANAGA|nr:hypothetical protein DPX16_16872 [Anabarilius grahami]
MNLPAFQLLCLEQRDCSLEEHTKDFLHFACQTHFPDHSLCSFYYAGLLGTHSSGRSQEKFHSIRGVGAGEQQFPVFHWLGRGQHQPQFISRDQPSATNARHDGDTTAHCRPWTSACHDRREERTERVIAPEPESVNHKRLDFDQRLKPSEQGHSSSSSLLLDHRTGHLAAGLSRPGRKAGRPPAYNTQPCAHHPTDWQPLQR